MTEVLLRESLQEFEGIGEIKIGYDENGNCKGYAFVTIEGSEENFQKVLNTNVYYEGRLLDISAAHSKKHRPDTILRQMSHKIHVKKLPFNVTDEKLRSIFSMFGEIIRAFVIVDPQTKVSKHFGFVEFKNKYSVDNVLNEPSFYIDKNKILITKFIPRALKEQANNNRNGNFYGASTFDFQSMFFQFHDGFKNMLDFECYNENFGGDNYGEQIYPQNYNNQFCDGGAFVPIANETNINNPTLTNYVCQENLTNYQDGYQMYHSQNQYYGVPHMNSNMQDNTFLQTDYYNNNPAYNPNNYRAVHDQENPQNYSNLNYDETSKNNCAQNYDYYHKKCPYPSSDMYQYDYTNQKDTRNIEPEIIGTNFYNKESYENTGYSDYYQDRLSNAETMCQENSSQNNQSESNYYYNCYAE